MFHRHLGGFTIDFTVNLSPYNIVIPFLNSIEILHHFFGQQFCYASQKMLGDTPLYSIAPEM